MMYSMERENQWYRRIPEWEDLFGSCPGLLDHLQSTLEVWVKNEWISLQLQVNEQGFRQPKNVEFLDGYFMLNENMPSERRDFRQMEQQQGEKKDEFNACWDRRPLYVIQKSPTTVRSHCFLFSLKRWKRLFQPCKFKAEIASITLQKP